MKETSETTLQRKNIALTEAIGAFAEVIAPAGQLIPPWRRSQLQQLDAYTESTQLLAGTIDNYHSAESTIAKITTLTEYHPNTAVYHLLFSMGIDSDNYEKRIKQRQTIHLSDPYTQPTQELQTVEDTLQDLLQQAHDETAAHPLLGSKKSLIPLAEMTKYYHHNLEHNKDLSHEAVLAINAIFYNVAASHEDLVMRAFASLTATDTAHLASKYDQETARTFLQVGIIMQTYVKGYFKLWLDSQSGSHLQTNQAYDQAFLTEENMTLKYMLCNYLFNEVNVTPELFDEVIRKIFGNDAPLVDDLNLKYNMMYESTPPRDTANTLGELVSLLQPKERSRPAPQPIPPVRRTPISPTPPAADNGLLHGKAGKAAAHEQAKAVRTAAKEIEQATAVQEEADKPTLASQGIIIEIEEVDTLTEEQREEILSGLGQMKVDDFEDAVLEAMENFTVAGKYSFVQINVEQDPTNYAIKKIILTAPYRRPDSYNNHNRS